MNCAECGSPVAEDDLFCGVCGAVVDPPTASVSPATAEQAPPAVPSARLAPARDSRASTAFILGCVSVGLAVVSCIPLVSIVSCVGPVIGIIAIVLGSIAGRELDTRGGSEQDRKKARQGVILGIVGTILYVVMFVLSMVLGMGFSILSEL